MDSLTLLVAQPNGTFMYDHSGVLQPTISSTGLRRPSSRSTARAGPRRRTARAIPFLGNSRLDRRQAQLLVHQRGALLVRVQGRRGPGRSSATTTCGSSSTASWPSIWAASTAAEGSITLDARPPRPQFNLTKGKVYEIACSRPSASRRQSSYKLTLGQFNRTHTDLQRRCGDGIVNGSESCDR